MTTIKVQVLEGGKLPYKKNMSDAGFDVFATEDVILYPGAIYKLPLNIKMELPKGTYLEVKTKSGLGSKGMLVYAGVIDEGYRGVPHVICTNLMPPPLGDGDYIPRTIQINKGEKLAQLVPFPFHTDYIISEVDEVSEDTARGTGGFGSTGST
jgi:dUTP pyrophosphatase